MVSAGGGKAGKGKTGGFGGVDLRAPTVKQLPFDPSAKTGVRNSTKPGTGHPRNYLSEIKLIMISPECGAVTFFLPLFFDISSPSTRSSTLLAPRALTPLPSRSNTLPPSNVDQLGVSIKLILIRYCYYSMVWHRMHLCLFFLLLSHDNNVCCK